MNRRFALAAAAIALLAVSAGCLGYATGGGEVTNETLDAEPPREYDFDTDRDAAFDLSTDGRYTVVYAVGDREEIRLYQQTPYAGDQPLQFEALRYRYPDGEVINGSEFRARGGEVERTTDETWIRFADEMAGGKIAFSGAGSPRRFTMRAYVDGSYAVTLPPGFSTDAPIVGHVSPRDHSVVTVDGRDRIVWDEVTGGSIVVQSYREGDLVVFGVILVVAAIAAVVGTLYFRRQLEALRERRRDLGLGVDDDRDDDGWL
ncbi:MULTISPECIES: DUF5803 family protein [Halorubrum]|uniref:Uncharacterized protein n=1 Tax=Halorubrum sodomense TaxID=35743 RepID=A0A1I6FLW3_HALSD|nr:MULTISPECIES: DUF5803 family protein [Halorubrum]TKX54555.1 hypothetical protein EXE42_07165 [Halorubrum sp. SP3]TKX66944.1 hypothetical protein EXE45_14755 [Halorubrum sp. SP9]SFR30920.1 hypothetical protein SAMN04487937_0755 [Halorubrum sodomense]